MDITVLLALFSSILEQPGSFFEKVLLGSFALIGLHLIGKNHINGLEKGMNSQLKSIVLELQKINERLNEGAVIHEKHTLLINEHSKQIKDLKIEMIKLTPGNEALV